MARRADINNDLNKFVRPTVAKNLQKLVDKMLADGLTMKEVKDHSGVWYLEQILEQKRLPTYWHALKIANNFGVPFESIFPTKLPQRDEP